MTKKQPRETQIDITARHGHVSDGMRDYALKKAEKLTRFHDRITRIQVLLDDPKGEREVEMIAHIEAGGTLVARERAGAFHEAVDLLVEKLERQLKKDKERMKDHKIEGGKGVIPSEPTPSADSEETYDDVMRRKLE
ncbi:MAG: ribosome-associated translation inhibitor RaiA [Planctomycetota bacterium]